MFKASVAYRVGARCVCVTSCVQDKCRATHFTIVNYCKGIQQVCNVIRPASQLESKDDNTLVFTTHPVADLCCQRGHKHGHEFAGGGQPAGRRKQRAGAASGGERPCQQGQGEHHQDRGCVYDCVRVCCLPNFD